ncbi:MAG: ABC transporter permease [Angelakisella sp.]|jgi:ABC-type dipeptide/oligopeptide/nickel transport system permease component|nr:ABC transporter permease [Angelakisella sp.]
MSGYIIKRLFQGVLTFLGVSVLVFVLGRVTGDPVALLAPDNATAEQKEQIRESLGLNDPVAVQYWNFITKAVQGDFGTSYVSRQSVTKLVKDTLPATLQLAVASFLIAVVVSIPIGILVALKRNTVWDLLGNVLALVGQAMPNFWLALMLMLVFSVKLKLLPISGREGPANMVLPVLTLALAALGYFVRMVRSSMLEVLGQEYIRTARGKGVRELMVVGKHALKNALIPVITVMGIHFGNLLSGAFVIETVFAWPGLGRLGVTALFARDFAVIQGVVLVSTAIFVLVNLVVDILYTLLDPRIRME